MHHSVYEQFCRDLPRLPWFRVMADLRQAGTFSYPDQARLERFRVFPDWFAEFVPNGFEAEFASRQLWNTTTLDAEQKIWHQAPGARVDHWIPSELTSGPRSTSAIKVVKAENVVATTEPFLKTYRAQGRRGLPGGFIPDLTDRQAVWLPAALKTAGIRPKRLKGRTLVVIVEGAGYAHWTLDMLPRLELIKASGHDFGDFNNIVLSHTDRDYECRTLAQLDIPISRVGPSGRPDTDNYLHFDGPVTAVTTIRQPQVASSRALACVVAHHRFAKAQRAHASAPKVLYLARRTAGRRPVIGEDELVTELVRSGVDVLDAATTPMSDLVRRVRLASTILAPHGAALANVVFANPGTNLVEFHSGHLSHHFWSASQMLDLHHFAYQCPDGHGTMHDDTSLQPLDFTRRNGMPIALTAERVLDALSHFELDGAWG